MSVDCWIKPIQQLPKVLIYMNRQEQIQKSKEHQMWDVLVIGGGASGLGVALDAVSRGLSVCLLEKYDFGKGTSSRSTKLVHGGVRYLQQGNLALVREALKEREYILEKASHIARVQPFIVPCYSWWSALYYFMGLSVYDILSGRKTIGGTKWLSKKEVLLRIPNMRADGLRAGIQYIDGQFDDTRLCIDLVKTIVHAGGTCVNHAGAAHLLKEDGKVVGATVRDELNGEEWPIRAQYVVNAAGIFTDDIVQMDAPNSRKTIVPSRGSHLVLDKSFLGGSEAIMIPKTSDGRVLFVIPWLGKVIVGTTDERTDKPVLEPSATAREVQFMLANCQQYLTKQPALSDIQATFAGLRPLAAPAEGEQNTKEISRGHKIIHSPSGLVSIIGGKWTTFRKMGEDVVKQISQKYTLQWPRSKSIYIPIEKTAQHLGTLLHPELPYTDDDIVRAVETEMAMGLEDVLCRRTRSLFLSTNATADILDEVGQTVKSKLGKSDEWLAEQKTQMRELIGIYNIQNQKK